MNGALSIIDSPGLEIAIPAGLLLAAVLPFLRQTTPLQKACLVALPLALTAGLGYIKYTLDSRNDSSYAKLLDATPAQTQLKPVTEPNNSYASSRTCRACHPSEYNSWHNSYHRTMTQLAKPGTVLAKWHGTELSLGQMALQLEQKHDEFWVNKIGTDGTKAAPQRMTMTTGSHHLQVYWIADSKGNMQHPFPYGWLIADQKWVPVQDTFLHDPNLPIGGAKWNNICIKCHVVAGRPNPDNRNRTFNSETAELGISCEACHRPAEAHIAHYQNPVNRYRSHLDGKAAHGILNPGDKTLDHRLSSQVCGQCHSYQYTPDNVDWLNNGTRFLPGNELNANTRVVHASSFAGTRPKQQDEAQSFMARHGHPHPGDEWLKDRFWIDGMVRVTGREYNGLLDTPCFQRGKLSCLSCHSMHGYHDKNDQLAPRMESNEACFQCHEDFRDDPTAHTHHTVGSAGSLCYNCHMPHTTYGLLSGIRSHQIDSPSVETHLKTGRPNACNLCHLDQTLEWSSRHLAKWYGHRQPQLDNDDKTISSMLKMLLKGDAGQRSIAAWHMGWEPARKTSGSNWLAPWLLRAMDDPYSAIRTIAHKALTTDPAFADTPFDYTAPLAKRSSQVAGARKKLRELQVPGQAAQPKLLLDATGQPLDDDANKLARQRDNRPMTLQE